MSVKEFSGNVLHVEGEVDKFPDSIKHRGDTYSYGTLLEVAGTVAVYYRESWIRG